MTKGERIKELRTRHNLSQEELANMLNTTKQTIYKYEKNIVTNIPIDKIETMASLFHVTPEYICCWNIGAGTVSEEEQEILYYMRQLNTEGKTALAGVAESFSKMPIYKKSDMAVPAKM